MKSLLEIIVGSVGTRSSCELVRDDKTVLTGELFRGAQVTADYCNEKSRL